MSGFVGAENEQTEINGPKGDHGKDGNPRSDIDDDSEGETDTDHETDDDAAKIHIIKASDGFFIEKVVVYRNTLRNCVALKSPVEINSAVVVIAA